MEDQNQAALRAADETTRMTLRLPADLADTLRAYVFLTRKSANTTIIDALTQYLETTGRDQMVAASTSDTAMRFGAILEKLGDS